MRQKLQSVKTLVAALQDEKDFANDENMQHN